MCILHSLLGWSYLKFKCTILFVLFEYDLICSANVCPFLHTDIKLKGQCLCMTIYW